MKNISEVAVGLAYSALLFNDQGLAAEVDHLEDRLDEMHERLEVWVLRSAADQLDPSPLRGLLHLSRLPRTSATRPSRWCGSSRRRRSSTRSSRVALGDSDEVVVRVPVGAGIGGDGRTLAELQLDIEPGFHVLAVRRGGRYLYRPRGHVRLERR